MTDNKSIITSLSQVLPDIPVAEIAAKLESPKSSDLGDVAFPTFTLAKLLRQAPQQIASDIVNRIDQSDFEKVVATGPYVNFFLDKK
ncbi:hypothetical protein ACG92U_03725 [Leuconostoc citreum]